jgi:hypothetical protein
MQPSYDLIFQYIFTIGSAAGLTFVFTFFTSYYGYRFIKMKLDKRRW